MTYHEFLEQKIDVAPLVGLDVQADQISSALKPHRGGRATAHCDLELVDSLDETERGDNGFGSTGR